MPRIELIPEVLYGPDDPIHWETDNMPLKAILRRVNLVNFAVDNILEQLRDAIGTQGSVANRLNQSIDEDGNLKTEAVDETLHSIEAHEDTDDYVRMTRPQSEKLDLIADEAKDVSIEVFTSDDDSIVFSEGVLKIKPSSTVTPSFESPDVLKLNFAFPVEAAHQHYYGLDPVSVNLMTPDYTNYKVNSVASEYVEDSLRVYINGIRIYQDVEVYVPGASMDDDWTLTSFEATPEDGVFELSRAITEDDIIRVDFDMLLS